MLRLGKDAAVPVAYKGGGEAAMAVLAGDVDFSCGNLTSMIGNIKGGKLHALMTTTPERLKDLPEVPTAREAGYPQLEAVIGWSERSQSLALAVSTKTAIDKTKFTQAFELTPITVGGKDVFQVAPVPGSPKIIFPSSKTLSIVRAQPSQEGEIP